MIIVYSILNISSIIIKTYFNDFKFKLKIKTPCDHGIFYFVDFFLMIFISSILSLISSLKYL